MSEIDFRPTLESLAMQGGGLVEIYAFDTSLADWQQVVDRLGETNRISSFESDRDEPGINITDGTFTEDGDVHATLMVNVGKQTWWTSFLSPDFIDFQGDPDVVTTTEDLHDIVEFMKEIASTTRKQVVLIPESVLPRETKHFFRVNPDGSTEA
ncbi:hypothetical protein AB0H34_41745 [Saccharopolyspora shandongensis]|uniref:hypothetical protein n=1 Tax=Saccharopolyspora shandongensis TaxID=418495 RepID=UPI0033F03B29